MCESLVRDGVEQTHQRDQRHLDGRWNISPGGVPLASHIQSAGGGAERWQPKHMKNAPPTSTTMKRMATAAAAALRLGAPMAFGTVAFGGLVLVTQPDTGLAVLVPMSLLLTLTLPSSTVSLAPELGFFATNALTKASGLLSAVVIFP